MAQKKYFEVLLIVAPGVRAEQYNREQDYTGSQLTDAILALPAYSHLEPDVRDITNGGHFLGTGRYAIFQESNQRRLDQALKAILGKRYNSGVNFSNPAGAHTDPLGTTYGRSRRG